MNILICGATGFIGRSFLERLIKNKKNRIFAVYNIKNKTKYPKSSVKWIKCDLRDEKAVNKLTKGMDVVIQAAATTTGSKDVINQPFVHVTDNAVMNAYLFRSCYLNKVKQCIFFSCTTMYKSSLKPIKEDDFNPLKYIEHKYFCVFL